MSDPQRSPHYHILPDLMRRLRDWNRAIIVYNEPVHKALIANRAVLMGSTITVTLYLAYKQMTGSGQGFAMREYVPPRERDDDMKRPISKPLTMLDSTSAGAMTKTGVSTEYHDTGDLVDRKRQDVGRQVDTTPIQPLVTGQVKGEVRGVLDREQQQQQQQQQEVNFPRLHLHPHQHTRKPATA